MNKSTTMKMKKVATHDEQVEMKDEKKKYYKANVCSKIAKYVFISLISARESNDT